MTKYERLRFIKTFSLICKNRGCYLVVSFIKKKVSLILPIPICFFPLFLFSFFLSVHLSIENYLNHFKCLRPPVSSETFCTLMFSLMLYLVLHTFLVTEFGIQFPSEPNLFFRSKCRLQALRYVDQAIGLVQVVPYKALRLMKLFFLKGAGHRPYTLT